jgi:hypothetical protein
MSRGYVALLDVLGFSALVASDSAGDRIERYLQCLQRTVGGGATPVDYVVFSDSIVLTVEGEDDSSLIRVASACSRLMGQLLTDNIPIRGAISHGHFVRSAIGQSVFVAGRAVIDAYRFEQQQEWIGVMIAPSALERVTDLQQRCELQGHTTVEAFREVEPRIQWVAFIQRSSDIPFREDGRFDGFAIIPTTGALDPYGLRDSIKEVIEQLNWLRAIAPTPQAQMKYSRTITWLLNTQRLWHEVAFRRDQARQA